MIDDNDLRALLKASLPPVVGALGEKNLWSQFLDREKSELRWPLLDLGVAAVTALALALLPDSLWLLVYHL